MLDSIDYLDPKSINGLNLYCYCNNSPVNFSYSSSISIGNVSVSGRMVSSTRGTLSNIVGSGSVVGGSKVSSFGSLG